MDEQIGWLTFGTDSAYSRCMNCRDSGGTAVPIPVYRSQIPQGCSWVCSSIGCESIVVDGGTRSTKLFYRAGVSRYYEFTNDDPDQALSEELLELIQQVWSSRGRR